MTGYEIEHDETWAVLDALDKMDFKGNILPMAWFTTICHDDGKPHLPAIVILSDIVYWYRPVDNRNEWSGLQEELRSKFKAKWLQRDRNYFMELFGLSEKQVRAALDHLQDIGIITKHIVAKMKDDHGNAISNVPYIELHPERLEQATFPPQYEGGSAL